MMSCQKSHPYKLKKGTIKDMKNEKLALIFRNFWLVDSYIRGVLLKETIIFLHSRKSGKSYEQSEEDCEKSEINLSEELRRIRSKKTWSWFYLHVFLFRPLVWGGGGILFYLFVPFSVFPYHFLFSENSATISIRLLIFGNKLYIDMMHCGVCLKVNRTSTSYLSKTLQISVPLSVTLFISSLHSYHYS